MRSPVIDGVDRSTGQSITGNWIFFPGSDWYILHIISPQQQLVVPFQPFNISSVTSEGRNFARLTSAVKTKDGFPGPPLQDASRRHFRDLITSGARLGLKVYFLFLLLLSLLPRIFLVPLFRFFLPSTFQPKCVKYVTVAGSVQLSQLQQQQQKQ